MKTLPQIQIALCKTNHLKYFSHFFTYLPINSQHYFYPALSWLFSFRHYCFFSTEVENSTLFTTLTWPRTFTCKQNTLSHTNTHIHKNIFFPYFLGMVISQCCHYLYYNDRDKLYTKIALFTVLSFVTKDNLLNIKIWLFVNVSITISSQTNSYIKPLSILSHTSGNLSNFHLWLSEIYAPWTFALVPSAPPSPETFPHLSQVLTTSWYYLLFGAHFPGTFWETMNKTYLFW